MAWLDPRFRCNRCGKPFADGGAVVCPGCGADLAAVGTQNELRDWGVTRLQGRRRYVWVRWVLGGGVPMVLISLSAFVTVRWIKGSAEDATFDHLRAAAMWPVVFWLIGHLTWRGAEREYAAAAEQRPA